MPRLVPIYKPDGSRFGGFGRAIPLDEAERELRALGLNPQTPQQRLLPGWRAPLGGVATGCCNVFELDDAVYTRAIDILESAGWKRWPEHDDPAACFYGNDDDDDDGFDEETAERSADTERAPAATQSPPVEPAPGSNARHVEVAVAALRGKIVRFLHVGEADDGTFRADRATIIVDRDNGRIVDCWVG